MFLWNLIRWVIRGGLWNRVRPKIAFSSEFLGIPAESQYTQPSGILANLNMISKLGTKKREML